MGPQYQLPHHQKETASGAGQPEGQQVCRREKGGGGGARRSTPKLRPNHFESSPVCLCFGGCCQLVGPPFQAGLHDMVAYRFVAHIGLCTLFLLVVCNATGGQRQGNDAFYGKAKVRAARPLFWEGEGTPTLAASHQHLPRLCWGAPDLSVPTFLFRTLRISCW